MEGEPRSQLQLPPTKSDSAGSFTDPAARFTTWNVLGNRSKQENREKGHFLCKLLILK
jgi:hypothetical protein